MKRAWDEREDGASVRTAHHVYVCFPAGGDMERLTDIQSGFGMGRFESGKGLR
jgi:hypothetical protein